MTPMRHLVLLVITLFCCTASASEIDSNHSWQTDADRLTQLLLEVHAAPVSWTDREKLTGQLATTRKVITGTESMEVKAASILAAVAALQDGHSIMDSGSRYEIFGYAGFSCEVFDDGVFLVRVPEQQPELLGAEITAIGDHPITDVLDELRPYVPHAVESRFRRWACSYLHLPGLLSVIGISDNPSETVLTLKKQDGVVITQNFTRQTAEQSETTVRVGIDQLKLPQRLREKHDEAYYGFELLDDGRALYFDYNRVGNDESEPYWEIDARFFAALDESKATRLIIDMRDNGGGGYQYGVWLVSGLLARDRFLKPGALIVLTEKRTFSAAMQVLNDLQSRAGAIIVGGNTGDRPHAPGDPKSHQLPHSGIELEISSRFHRSSYPQDDRKAFEPDVRFPDTFADRLKGQDPALDYARRYLFDPSDSETCRTDDDDLRRYDYGGGAQLVIDCSSRGTLEATVAGVFSTNLNRIHDTMYDSRIPGLRFLLDDKGPARLISPSGQVTELKPIESTEPSLWERIYSGDTKQTAPTLIELHRANPDNDRLSDPALTSEAINIYYTIKNASGRDAARKATALFLRTCIQIHGEAAENCRFSLRFYE